MNIFLIDEFAGTKDLSYYAVYDGHGGRNAVEHVKKTLHEKLITQLGSDLLNADIPDSITKSFFATDAELLEKKEKSGTTAAVAIIRRKDDGNILYTANVGDARIVLNRNGTGVALTKDHKSTDPEEVQLLKSKGALVFLNKVGGTLAVSRAFGDNEMKRWITVEPYQEQVKLNNTDTHLIIACDGLWDVCTNQEAVDLIRNGKDAQQMSIKLMKYALEHGSTDNVTVAVIVL